MHARVAWPLSAVIAVVLLASGAAAADVAQGVRVDQLQPAAPQSPFLRAEGPHAPDVEGVELAVGLAIDYAKAPLRAAGIDAEGGEAFRVAVIEHAVLMHVGASLSPARWLTFDLNLPVSLVETGEDGVEKKGYAPVEAAAGAGVGDPRIGMHVRPFDRKTVGLLLGARFWAPVGATAAYLSDRRLRGEANLGLAGDLGRVLYGCSVGIGPMFFAGRDGDRVAAACALHVRAASFLSLGVEPTAAVFADEPKPDERAYSVLFEPMGAARLSFGSFRVGLSAGPGFGGAPGTAELRGVLGIAYVGGGKPPEAAPPAPSDRDLDKIPDAEDACPSEAGPTDPDPQKHGCPVLDRDADGVLDSDDYCPDRPGVRHDSPAANGCPDSDNDTLPDPIDGCRSEPGAAPGGCPKYARLTKEGFNVTPRIELAAGDIRLPAAARAALEEVAATMRANPKLEQVSVSLGTKGAKPQISDKRAKEIILVLRGGSLDSNRFEVVLRDDLKAGTVTFRIVK